MEKKKSSGRYVRWSRLLSGSLSFKEAGYDVTGVTMQIWQSEDEEDMSGSGGCCGLSAVDDARRVARDIGIPYYVMNFRDEFKDKGNRLFCK